jgi:CubicO group peptidase (beta-lactamase class C family)
MQTEVPINDTTVRCFFHTGDGGQLLMVIPELDMVVVFTGGIYGADTNGFYHNIMSEYVLSTVDPGS